jgi:hypothetical protein
VQSTQFRLAVGVFLETRRFVRDTFEYFWSERCDLCKMYNRLIGV